LGIAGTGLALFAMTTLVGRVGATRGSAVTYTFPIVAILLGVLFRDEKLHPIAIAGTVLVIVGAYIVSRAERGAPPN
jgi:drug/metabolite transporter (DMT)-like permease